jgi:hypothetical protein
VSSLVNMTGDKERSGTCLASKHYRWIGYGGTDRQPDCTLRSRNLNLTNHTTLRQDGPPPYSTDRSTHALLSPDETSIRMTCPWRSRKEPDSRVMLIHGPSSCPGGRMATAERATMFKSGLFRPLSANLLTEASKREVVAWPG